MVWLWPIGTVGLGLALRLMGISVGGRQEEGGDGGPERRPGAARDGWVSGRPLEWDHRESRKDEGRCCTTWRVLG